ncbi:MAG: hypothetical protein H0V12_08145, partial [Chloroflexi bacterium]|nr:hypothetical protein [Chloroflexota bacterium]
FFAECEQYNCLARVFSTEGELLAEQLVRNERVIGLTDREAIIGNQRLNLTTGDVTSLEPACGSRTLLVEDTRSFLVSEALHPVYCPGEGYALQVLDLESGRALAVTVPELDDDFELVASNGDKGTVPPSGHVVLAPYGRLDPTDGSPRVIRVPLP